MIFLCMCTRAVHIEVIETINASSFINALRRFFAISGPAKQIRSDCGTNFIGASCELKMDEASSSSESVQEYLKEQQCSWVFNTPHVSHMGGAWERMIGIARNILDCMLLQQKHTCLTHEVLITLMAEVTAVMNARPLVPVSSDPEAPFILTPATLLTQKCLLNCSKKSGSRFKDWRILFGIHGRKNILEPYRVDGSGRTNSLVSKKGTLC